MYAVEQQCYQLTSAGAEGPGAAAGLRLPPGRPVRAGSAGVAAAGRPAASAAARLLVEGAAAERDAGGGRAGPCSEPLRAMRPPEHRDAAPATAAPPPPGRSSARATGNAELAEEELGWPPGESWGGGRWTARWQLRHDGEGNSGPCCYVERFLFFCCFCGFLCDNC